MFGRLAQSTDVSYTTFELTDGNVYGVVGATVYAVLRGFIYSGMLISYFIFLTKAQLGSPKAREELKSNTYTIIINFAMIYAIPQITDIILFAKDGLLYAVANALGVNGTSILETMNRMYTANPSFIGGVVYTATAAASIFYAKDYISIALQQTILFGFYPGVALMGVHQKKMQKDWAAVYFSNMFIPVIDVVLFLIPYIIISAFGNNGTVPTAIGIIIVCVIWSARAARIQLLRVFGNVTQTPAGRGLGAVGAMALMAARQFGGAFKRGSGDSISTRTDENFDKGELSDRQQSIDNEMAGQAKDINDELGLSADNTDRDKNAVDDMLSEDGNYNDYEDDNSLEDGISADNIDADMSNLDTDDPNAIEGELTPSTLDVPEGEAEEVNDYTTEAPQIGTTPPIETGEPLAMEEMEAPVPVTSQEGVKPPADPELSMTAFEQERFNNLKELDSDKKLLQTGTERIDNLTQRSERLGSQIEQLSSQPKIPAQMNPEGAANQAKELKALQEEKARVDRDLTQTQDRMKGASERIEKRQTAEKSYAQVAKEHGRDGQIYTSSGDFKRSMETKNKEAQRVLERAKRMHAANSDELRKLSPEAAKQYEQIMQKNERIKTAAKVGKTAAKVTGAVIGGTVAATIAGYGGASASITAAALGGMLTGSATGKVGEAAGRIDKETFQKLEEKTYEFGKESMNDRRRHLEKAKSNQNNKQPKEVKKDVVRQMEDDAVSVLKN